MLEVNIKKRLFHFDLEAAFTLEKGIMALVGKSGSGKTTILNCIAGVASPDSGVIRLNGQILDLKDKSLPVQKREIGYLFQEYALFPHMTVLQNIQYGMKDEMLVKELLVELQINHLKNRYPAQISGGEKQRVALARALATKPRLLLLDEPFGALDDETKELSHTQLLKLHKQWNIPIILVTHSKLEAAKLADVIYKVDKGKLIRQ